MEQRIDSGEDFHVGGKLRQQIDGLLTRDSAGSCGVRLLFRKSCYKKLSSSELLQALSLPKRRNGTLSVARVRTRDFDASINRSETNQTFKLLVLTSGGPVDNILHSYRSYTASSSQITRLES